MLAMAKRPGSQTNSPSWQTGGGWSSPSSPQKPPASSSTSHTDPISPTEPVTQQTSRAPHQEMGTMARRPSSLGQRPWEAGSLSA